ncbi:MAG: LCP family protein, partial [Streptosporangiaceae bacterium]
LRDLGRELEHEPTASLTRQRNRLLDTPPRRRLAGQRRWVLLGLASVVTAAAVVVPTVLAHQQIRSSTSPLNNGDAGPALNHDAMNILVLGSDSRAGANAKYGRDTGGAARSDTTLLVHLPKGRQEISVLSFRRDTVVRIPQCGKRAAHLGSLNSAYTEGGAACSRKMIEQLTKVRVDHSIEVDFSGFQGMVDALGGVEITLPEALRDPRARLDLPRGKQTVDGEQALAFVRTRAGNGSDLGRIRRQHQLMAALADKARLVLGDPVRMARFALAAGRRIRIDGGLEVSSLLRIARSLDDQSTTTFLTVPWTAYPADPHRLQLRQPQADRLFQRLRTG